MSEGLFEAQWDEAREIVHGLAPRVDVETSDLASSVGRIVASDIHALGDMPPFAASRIDGWAVAGAGPWTVIGDITAGHSSDVTLSAGQCTHIATGAVLPTGATGCLKDEESFLDDNIVSAAHGAIEILVGGALPDQHDVRPSGYEARKGDVLVHRGTRITPGIIGVIAGGGHDNVSVYRQVTVDVLVFGDELLTSGPSRDGKVRDSLGPQLPAWIDQLGARLLHVTHVEDTLEAHTKAIKNSVADLIITTGGTAAGPVDHLHQAIVDCEGEFVIDAVMVRPGYHQLFAKLPGQFLLGLPGNPQSAVIGLLTLGDAFLRGSISVPLPELPTVEMAVNTKAPPREIRLALCTRNGGKAEPVEHLDSSMLRGFVTADGYALVPAGGAVAGDLVRWLNLP